MKIKTSLNQSGAASLLTVMVLSIVLLMITTALMRLSIIDQRSSLDDDLSSRAYYAAESGIQDAILALRTDLQDNGQVDQAGPGGLLNAEICDKQELVTTSDTLLEEVEIECQLIEMEPQTLEANLAEGETIQLPLTPSGNPAGIILKWHLLDGNPIARRLSTDTSLPSKTTWPADPAMLRVNIFSHDKNSPFNRASLIASNNIALLNPADLDAALSVDNNFDSQIVAALCSDSIPGETFACTATINGFDFANNQYYIRITPMYTGTDIELSLPGGEAFLNAQAKIDVTGRSQDVYRRIRTTVDLSASQAGSIESILPDDALTIGSDICKQLTVVDDGTTDEVVSTCP